MATILSFIALLAVIPNGASAASAYDDNFHTTENLHVSSDYYSYQCDDVDVTSYVKEYILNPPAFSGSSIELAAMQDSFEEALDNGNWGISQWDYSQSGSYLDAVSVYWSESDNLKLNWTIESGTVFAETDGVTSNVHAVSIACRPSHTDEIWNELYFTQNRIAVSTSNPSNPLGSTGNMVVSSYFFTGDANLPSGYEGVDVPTASPAARYVAMGDSYSSGEGNSPYEYVTDKDDVNQCHRSTNAYPRMLRNILDLGSMAFVACSGATTADVLTGGVEDILSGDGDVGNWGEGPQVDALSAETEKVTITIGGNDLGFAEVIKACAHYPNNPGWGCSTDTSLNDDIDERMEALAGTNISPVFNHLEEIQSVLDVLRAISTDAPNASIFIAGYPHLFGSDEDDFDDSSNAPSGFTCLGTVAATFDYADAQWMNDGVDDLNNLIHDAVTDAQEEEIDATYVTPDLFLGHGNCDESDSWIHPILPSVEDPLIPMPESFHPNFSGMSIGYESIFESYLN